MRAQRKYQESCPLPVSDQLLKLITSKIWSVTRNLHMNIGVIEHQGPASLKIPEIEHMHCTS